MFLKQAIRSTMFACVLLSACGHSGDDDPQPVKPEPDPPVEETYLTVATRDGASVEAYDLTFAAFEQTLVVRSNVRWDVSAGDAAAWLHVTAASAATARVSIDVNTGREVRSGKIVFTTEDAKVRIEIPVTQRFGETIGRAPIRDLMLIYDATDTGRLFDEKRFAKYLATTDDAPQWLFDGYLFLTLHRGGKSFGAGYKKPASNKKDWEAVLDYYLADEHSIPALDRAAGELRAKIGGTFHRRKVVIFLPDPQEGQTDWGEIDGRALDFNNYPDRIAACKWYVDRVVEKFAEHDFRNIQLSGIYWLPEHGGFIASNLRQIADYVHSKNLDFHWIPYYDAFGHADWKNYGFDYACYQPNYCFSTTIPRQRLYDAVREAQQAGMGLEVEFDSNYGFDRNVAYIDVYEELGVLEKSNLAYYGGTTIEYWMDGIAEERAFYQRLAKIVAERQKKFYNE